MGPRSAGAEPGPACYGKGDELTVTDANLLLGRLDPAYFLGGRMTLDLERARGLAKALGARLGLTERALAEGIVRIANANMERAIRVVSVQRGFDPREFALLAFGGAGGLHACDLADSLEMGTVLIPEHSGVLSALGMLLADVVKDYSASMLRPTAEMTEAMLQEALEPLLARAHADLAEERFHAEDILLEPTLAMRYTGQAYEIAVPFAPDFREAFHRGHAKLYGYANPARATEIVQLRVRAVGRTEKPALAPARAGRAGAGTGATAVRAAVFGERVVQTPVFHREELACGDVGEGPAMVISGQSTNVITPGFGWRIDAAGTLIATRRGWGVMRTDPVEFEIFKNFFVSIAEEMGVTLCRTGFSPNIKERLDYSLRDLRCGGGDDRAGGSSAGAPGGDAALGEGGDRACGDGGGRYGDPERSVPRRDAPAGYHAGVAGVLTAAAKRPAFFVANRAHHSDVGGMSPGSMPLAREVFQEGLIIPPVKLVKRGRIDAEILALILANVRTPEEREGDLTAQIAANRVGETRLLDAGAAVWIQAHGALCGG